jgi:hypothetical protein
VSACLSLLISVAASQSGQAWVGSDPVPGGLLAALGSVEDPRSRRGVRHRLFTVLAIGVCAVLAGAQTFTAIAEWAQDLTPAVCIRLGIGRRAPSESTIRRVLQAVDAEALDGAVSAWLVTRSAPLAAALRMIAIDGKSVCGARRADGRAVHLLAAFDQVSGIVLDQSVVEGKTNEITAFAPLLNRIDITGAIITADALCRRRHKASREYSADRTRLWPWTGGCGLAGTTRDRLVSSSPGSRPMLTAGLPGVAALAGGLRVSALRTCRRLGAWRWALQVRGLRGSEGRVRRSGV